MSSGTINGIITAILLAAFIGGWIWVFSAKRKKEFDEAARLPLDDEDEGKTENDTERKDRP